MKEYEEPRNKPPELEKRKPYEKPVLTGLGDVASLSADTFSVKVFV